MNLQKIFDPESVAVVGATEDKNKVGYSLVWNLLRGKTRKIYPITLNKDKILGLTAYHSVLEVEGKIDLVLIAIPAEFVPQTLVECGKKKVPFVVVVSAGFKEMGGEGKKLEEKIKEVARRYKISLLGPNCLGIINSQADLNATFAAEKPLAGKISFLSQSGATGTAMLDWSRNAGVGFSKFVSLGNEAGLTELDFMEYFAKDGDTDALLIYLEKVTDGRKFMELAKEITKTKPIVVIKAGRSPRGSAAVMSHTGSLAPADAVFTAACRECGIITVESLREFFDFTKLFRMGILRPLRRLAVVTNGGGPSVVAADLIDLSRSLELAELPVATQSALQKVLPPMAATGNPVDVIGDAGSKRYDDALKILTAQKNIDGIIAILTPQMMTDAHAVAGVLVAHTKEKPIIPVFMGGPAVQKGIEVLQKGSLANFDFPKDAVEVLDAMFPASKKSPAKPPTGKSGAQNAGQNQKMADFPATLKLLSRYGVKIPGVLLRRKDELAATFKKFKNEPLTRPNFAEQNFGGLAMKIISKDIIHKTDAGGVRLNLKTEDDAAKAWDGIIKSAKSKNPKAKIQGMFVQPMAKGKEVIVGMKRDPIFGPIIVFGLGGIFVEALKDTSMRVAPVNIAEAHKMIEEIKGYKILRGLRGERSVNMGALAKIIVAVSKLSLAHPEIKEIDLNPVIADSKKASVVDARIII
jgi:acetyltransferase